MARKRVLSICLSEHAIKLATKAAKGDNRSRSSYIESLIIEKEKNHAGDQNDHDVDNAEQG